jgi:hypothetical protein
MSEIKNRGGEPPARKSLWQRLRDAEDAYWTPQQAACVKCGEVDDLPKGVEYDEYLCPSCLEDEEETQAQDYLMHMVEMTERK